MVKELTKKAKPLEKQVSAAIVKWLKRQGWHVDVITKAMYGANGISDLICLKHGIYLALEVKREPGMKCTPLQEEWGKQVLAHGGIWRVVGSVAEVEAIVIWAEKGGML